MQKLNKKADASTGNSGNEKQISPSLLFRRKGRRYKITIQNILNNPHLFEPGQVRAAAWFEFLAR